MSGPDTIDTIEISIPFSTINLNLSTTDTVGISFEVTNTVNAWDYWPSTASIDDPSTWGEGVFTNQTVGITSVLKSKDLVIYPNPATDYVFFKLQNIKSDVFVEIHDISGRVVLSERIPNVNKLTSINISELKKGTYLVKLLSKTGMSYQAMLVK
jgi:hypothetical protein